jgi:hypothetical protein
MLLSPKTVRRPMKVISCGVQNRSIIVERFKNQSRHAYDQDNKYTSSARHREQYPCAVKRSVNVFVMIVQLSW